MSKVLSHNFKVYKSSAGSGKTYTLVREYLKLCLKSNSPNSYKTILAMTFTNKAATEMKERVIETLYALSVGEYHEAYDANYLKQISEHTGLKPTLIQTRSKVMLNNMLHNFSDLGICTLDKFTHRIVRTFAKDLKIPVDFNVEIDENGLLGQTIDLLVDEIGQNEEVTTILKSLNQLKTEEGKDFKVEKDLLDFSKTINQESTQYFIKKLRKFSAEKLVEIQSDFIKKRKGIITEINGLAGETIQLIDSNGIIHDSFNRSFYPNFFKRFSDGIPTDKKQLTPSETYFKNIRENLWYAKSKPDNIKAAIDSIIPELTDRSNKLLELINQFVITDLISKHIHSIALLSKIDGILNQIREDEGLLLISDFNRKISGIIKSEPVPFIYERLGEKYEHFLLDEFQDNSVAQWHNILPLVTNSLAKGGFNLIVGDGKQSIYRWRNGEVEQFMELPKVYQKNNNPIFEDYESELERYYENNPLDTNYRSSKNVIDFNNWFFKSFSRYLSEKYQAIYESVTQKVHHKDKEGYVNVSFFEKQENDENHEYYFDRIIEDINNALSRNYHLKDIAILVRQNKVGTLIADHLTKNNIKVVSNESLKLGNNIYLKLITAYFNAKLNPNEKLYKFEILWYVSQLKELDINKLVKDFMSKNGYNLTIDIDTFFIANNLHFNLDKKNLMDLTLDLINGFGLPINNNYIQFYLECIHNFSQKNGNSLNQFMHYWNNKGKDLSVKTSDNENAVKILTIHKSKGLQFPVVIMPCNWKIKKGNENIWTDIDEEDTDLNVAYLPVNNLIEKTKYGGLFQIEEDKSLLDQINLLYVAYTRAENELYIYSKQNAKSGQIEYLIKETCESNEAFNSNDFCLEFGEKEVQKKTELTYNSAPLKEVKLADTSNLSFSYQAPLVWKTDSPKEHTEYGNLLHGVLAKINYKADIPAALDFIYSDLSISDALKARLKEDIDRLFKIEQFSAFFSDSFKVKVETEIIDNKGHIHIPDRIIFNDSKTIVIDYKTGTERKKYKKQVLEYGKLLSEMGYKNIDLYLIYTENGEIELV